MCVCSIYLDLIKRNSKSNEVDVCLLFLQERIESMILLRRINLICHIFKMRILGLTGGIATGKSSASEYFQSQGIPIVDADQLARLVVEPGRPAYSLILQYFGHLNILQTDKQLDRKKLGNLVFENESLRKQLNRCTHGYIRREALKQIILHFFHFESLVIWDVPLLFEVGLDRYLSHTLVISCDLPIQFHRLKQRDQINDQEQIQRRIDAQMSLTEKCRRARYVIDNNGTKEMLHKELKLFSDTIKPNWFHTGLWFVILCIPLSLMYVTLRLWNSVDQIKSRRQ